MESEVEIGGTKFIFTLNREAPTKANPNCNYAICKQKREEDKKAADVKRQIERIAKAAAYTFESFKEVGFEEDQAFELTRRIKTLFG